MDTKRCLFCKISLTGIRAKEHIFPQWLLRHFSMEKELVEPTTTTFITEVQDQNEIVVGSQIIAKRTQTMNSMVAGKVCSNCNCGWMSDLEKSVKLLLIALASGERLITQSAEDLTQKESFLLARWAVKTAYVLDHSILHGQNVPLSHVHQLYNDNNVLPKSVNVFIGRQSNNTKIAWHDSRTWYGKHIRDISAVGRAEFNMKTSDSYKVTLLIGKLLLLVAYFPDQEWFMATAQGVHRTLWSQSVFIGELPFDPNTLASDSKPLMRFFSDELKIMHGPSCMPFMEHYSADPMGWE